MPRLLQCHLHCQQLLAANVIMSFGQTMREEDTGMGPPVNLEALGKELITAKIKLSEDSESLHKLKR